MSRSQALTDHAVVFVYHHFGEGPPATTVTLEQFDAHLDTLAREGFEVWPLGRILEHLRDRKSLPKRTAAITVDDAYISVYREAWPRLKKRGWPMTLFASTDVIDRGYKAYMSWAQLNELAGEGVEIGNHSASHGHLARRRKGEERLAWKDRVMEDILKAQERLKKKAGIEPKLFAYPYGEYSEDLKLAVEQAGFEFAAAQQSGVAHAGGDLMAVPRFAMAEAHAGIEGFRLKAAALPLVVRSAEPEGPIVDPKGPLKLTLRFAPAAADWDRLRCYTGEGAAAKTRWVDRGRLVVSITMPREPPLGRSRTNCTVPTGGRYRWYSHLWLRLP